MDDRTAKRPYLLGRGANLRPLVDRTGSGNRVAGIVKVDSKLWVAAIECCLAAGLGLLFSSTSDGGAVSITLYDGNDRSRSYATSPEELADMLAIVRDRAESRL